MLHETIHSLGKEEVRAFKLLLGRVESASGRVTERLFDYLRAHAHEPESGACALHLYGEDSPAMRDRLYAIRGKLLRELHRSLVYHQFDLDAEQSAWHDFLLARVLLKRGRSRLARQVLGKARRDADKADLFHVKELILREQLALAGEDLDLPVSALIDERRENDRKLEFVRSSQNAMAYTMQTLRKTNFATGGHSVIEVMARLQAQLQENQDIFQSPKGRLRLFNLTSNLLLQQGAYPQLELYIRQEYQYFLEQGFFDRSTHRTRIVMLTWLVNTTYKNFRFEDSLAYSRQLAEALEAYNRLHHDTFVLVLENGIVNNLLGLGKTEEAVARLERLLSDPKVMADDRAVYLLINLSEAQYELGRIRAALRALARVQVHAGFQGMAKANQLQVQLFELLLRYEDADWEYLATRGAQVQHWYAQELPDMPAQAHMLHVVLENAGKRSEGRKDGDLEWPELPDAALAAPTFLPGENEVIDYRLWLRCKREGWRYRDLLLQTLKEAARP